MIQQEKEIRTWMSQVELRESEDGKRKLSGYAIKWEQLSQKMGYWFRFREKFSKNAFKESIEKDDQRALWNHNTDIVLGRTKNNTLLLEEDNVGLRFEIDLPQTTWGNDIYLSVKRGDVDGVSFGFKKLGDEWDESDPDNIVRTVTKAQLFEVSPTPFPAYEGVTEVSARNIEQAYEQYKKEATPDGDKSVKIDEQRKYFNEVRKKLYSYD